MTTTHPNITDRFGRMVFEKGYTFEKISSVTVPPKFLFLHPLYGYA